MPRAIRPYVTFLTPTGDRPAAFALLEKWVGLQEFDRSWEWVVVDDGVTQTKTRMGQRYIRSETNADPVQSQSDNMMTGLAAVKSNRILILEDDDYYAPGYVAQMLKWFLHGDVIGMVPARYYNVRSRRYLENENFAHASLAQTGVQDQGIADLVKACVSGQKFIDLHLWRNFKGNSYLGESDLHVGIKGMPGRSGIGTGHDMTEGHPDTGQETARRWGIPQEYAAYGGWEIVAAKRVVVLGNGRSRLGLNLDALKKEAFVIGCNALYRDWLPDMLVSVDTLMTEEIRDAAPPCPHVYAQRGAGQSMPLTSTFGWGHRDEGWESGSTAAEVACRLAEGLREVFLVGVDLGSVDETQNNVYRGTRNYKDAGSLGGTNWTQVKQWATLIARNPTVKWYWVPPPSATSMPKEWRELPNLVLLDALPF